nr:unnamed protein product [Callosobruchus chinensis]
MAKHHGKFIICNLRKSYV